MGKEGRRKPSWNTSPQAIRGQLKKKMAATSCKFHLNEAPGKAPHTGWVRNDLGAAKSEEQSPAVAGAAYIEKGQGRARNAKDPQNSLWSFV